MLVRQETWPYVGHARLGFSRACDPLYGSPPKVIWLKCGNKPRWYVTSLLLKHRDKILAFGKDAEADVVEISE
jgi:predicted nuclease of predicted toxin-antitoxin system